MPTFFTDLFQYPFLQFAVLAGVLASLASGIVGSLVVVRRMTYIAGAISHAVLGGMGAARYLEVVHGVTWMTPLLGATAAALAAALVMGGVTLYGQQREDTVLSAIWAIGMALGISFISATPGYSEDLMSYLFGNILMVRARDLWLMLGLDLAILASIVLFYNKFLVIGFHEEMARLRSIRVGVYHMLLLILTALTIVLLLQVVGIVLVIALLSLPAATAGLFTRRLWQMMVVAVGLSLIFTVGGLTLSYGPEFPPGATIIELAGGGYVAALCLKRVLDAMRRGKAASS